MIGNRVIFAFLPLFLTLVITVSTAPVFDVQLLPAILGEVFGNGTVATTESVTYDDDDSKESDEEDLPTTTVEHHEETTTVPEVVTDGLLYADSTGLSLNIDEILELTDRLLSQNHDELPSTPTTESPEAANDDA